MKFYKSYLFVAILCTLPIKADFFAYQRWVHKDTGQRIHEFYDWHRSEGSAQKQQQEFVSAIKTCGTWSNRLAIIEDSQSRAEQAFKDAISIMKQVLSKPDIQTIKNAIHQIKKLFSPKLNLKDKLQKVLEKPKAKPHLDTPIAGLYDLCKKSNIKAANVECRKLDTFEELFLNVDIENEIMHYNDNELLNNYYQTLRPASLQISQRLIGIIKKRLIMLMPQHIETTRFEDGIKAMVGNKEKTLKIGPITLNAKIDSSELEPWIKLFESLMTVVMTNFVQGAHLVDARTLHLIYINPKVSDIFIAEGAMHISNINKMLPLLGFVPEDPAISQELQQACKTDKDLQEELQHMLDIKTTVEDNWILFVLQSIKQTTNITDVNKTKSILYKFPINIAEIFKIQPAQLIKSKL